MGSTTQHFLLDHGSDEISTSSMVILRRDVRLMGFFSLSACVLVWSLPLLSQWCDSQDFPVAQSLGDRSGNHCVAYRCSGFPRCADSDMGLSVSGFIMTPPATGMMTAAFSWPILHLWKLAEWLDRKKQFVSVFERSLERSLSTTAALKSSLKKVHRRSMYVFQLSFGLFVICTVDYFPIGHNVALGFTFIAGAVTYITLMLETADRGHRITSFILLTAIVSFLLVVMLNLSWVATTLMQRPPFILKDYNPWLFWIFEAVGLSCMALVPFAFEKEVID